MDSQSAEPGGGRLICAGVSHRCGAWDLPVEPGEGSGHRSFDMVQVDRLADCFVRLQGIVRPLSRFPSPGHPQEFRCDLEKTYFDVPRLRTSTAGGYLTSEIAYAFHPHCDTWYSAPQCQTNWWFPVYEIELSNGTAFHPRY
jgi:hypothetical protein